MPHVAIEKQRCSLGGDGDVVFVGRQRPADGLRRDVVHVQVFGRVFGRMQLEIKTSMFTL